MAEFGVCENPDCGLSYRRPALSGLFQRIAALENMERRKADISNLLPYLKHFETIFQFSEECSKCAPR